MPNNIFIADMVDFKEVPPEKRKHLLVVDVLEKHIAKEELTFKRLVPTLARNLREVGTLMDKKVCALTPQELSDLVYAFDIYYMEFVSPGERLKYESTMSLLEKLDSLKTIRPEVYLKLHHRPHSKKWKGARKNGKNRR